MTRKAERLRQSDVTFWGIVALACGGIAVVSANVAAFVPAGVMGGLHASRAAGGTVNQMRAQLADLDQETALLRQEARRLQARLTLAEQGRGEMTRRVGALEETVPLLAEAMVPAGAVDRSLMTSSIGDGATSIEAEGGTASVRYAPLLSGQPAELWSDQPLPEAIDVAALADDPSPSAEAPRVHAVALGGPVTAETAPAALAALDARVGALLLGLEPLLPPPDEAGEIRLVFGPIADTGLAGGLCEHMLRVGIDCATADFEGEALAD